MCCGLDGKGSIGELGSPGGCGRKDGGATTRLVDRTMKPLQGLLRSTSQAIVESQTRIVGLRWPN